MSKASKRHLIVPFFVLICCMLNLPQAYAQPSGGNFGLGIQFGEPSGLSLRIYQPGRMSADILLAWDLDDFFYANVHGTWEKSLGGSGDFNFFYGPGAFIGLRERNDRRLFDGDNDVNFGVSGTAGFNVYIDRVEIYVRVTPRLLLVDRTASDIGGGLGFRFYL
ncbi:hypothetical protein [Flavilitoribacter nigricans]|uniref:Outer membrane protein beta-barrel domain-containing protein n=1 Tax=Flavilitoribacter nigricans (strain ATCC 23147 / DSM 23189 / NBRC 102662 / NCIMB 1420 / SS-2) TaxID=1122177 RepID=A0A2D0N7X3_FLAN2|nr:hypothetical protein [Flavilitoribacter nigricans]PHN04498.1 hypothetical protein CRP01_21055 [Flavilitoribacter nigricans DSM 23189 = NBRC 102662]